MRHRAGVFSIVAICGLLAIGPAHAGLSSIPGIPGVPPLPSVKQATQGAVSHELVKQMGDAFFADQPLRTSADAEYPITASLPGGAFRPVADIVVQRLFEKSKNGVIDFPPGDYAIRAMAYCMLAHVHPPDRNKFRLTPIQGKWADIAAALYARTGTGSYDKRDVQILIWSMLAGMKYQELPPRAQALVDDVLPDYKSRMQDSFLDELHQKWQQISSNVPGVPSFDDALGQMGDVGRSIQEIESIRTEILNNAENFDQIRAEFADINVPRIPSDQAPTPWSMIRPGIYARLMDRGGYLNPAVFELRVTRQGITAMRAQMVAEAGRRGKGARQIAISLPDFFPFEPEGNAGYPGAAFQALGVGPEPGGSPPGGPGGGGGGGGNGSGPNPRPGSGGNHPQPNPSSSPDDNGGGGGGGGGGSGNHGGSGDEDDPGDANSPCDPPGNVFGVDKGKLLGDSVGGLSVGKGTGHGVVCLLLRPFVSMAALGWPDRGTGEVDDGYIGGTLFGQAPGGLVITAHYTYATSWSNVQGYVKKDVTAIIDYTSVTAPCPEVEQTLGVNGNLGSGWLSGPELENRDCIAGLAGGAMHVTAWVVDGEFTGDQSQAHEIDPSDVLYQDAWSHT